MLGLSISLYRLSPWHPIAQYPGPLLCKISKIYWALVTRDGQQHKLLAVLHRQYGEIVRIGGHAEGWMLTHFSLILLQVQMKYR